MTTTEPQELWQEYRNAVYGGAVSSDQERECSRCFYAGIAVAVSAMIDIAGNDETEELSAKRIELFLEKTTEAARGTLLTK